MTTNNSAVALDEGLTLDVDIYSQSPSMNPRATVVNQDLANIEKADFDAFKKKNPPERRVESNKYKIG